MMKQPEQLCDWTRLPPMGGPAPWQRALSPREKLPYPSTPPYFSFIFTLSTPLLYTVTRPCLFIFLNIAYRKIKQQTETDKN